MKKLINDPNDVVAEALIGIEAARPEVRVDRDNRIIYRRDAPIAGKVGLVSGGGSGHEPLHGGFVGLGMLDAAVPDRSSPHQLLIKCLKRPRVSTRAPASCTSSRTTRAM
jgi:dihydroxyacetone kinase